MFVRNLLFVCAASLAVTAAIPAYAALQEPSHVKSSLGVFNRVVDHTGKLIAAKNYTRLPHENDEFTEATSALEKAIAKEPDAFKSKIDILLNKASADSQSVAAAAQAHDDAKLSNSHDALSGSVTALLAAFPDDVQPSDPSKLHEKAEDIKTKITQ